ncbi:hypothetical protein ID866_10953 [Astraeus odoratus]|nr:hypothetical protein ID866_10953 [Astraeus odoratus]
MQAMLAKMALEFTRITMPPVR